MTGYEMIQNYDEDQMVEFLYHFANDVINNFGCFQMPNKESIKKFLEYEIPTNREED